MDTLKTFMETLKLTLYEILALLLPGAILVEAARELRLLTVNTTNSTGIIYFLALSYVGGLAARDHEPYLSPCSQPLAYRTPVNNPAHAKTAPRSTCKSEA